MKKLILIDGNAIVHRAFHALPNLTNKKGEITNAIYGFFSMFISILNTQKPDYVIVCFDKGKPVFRQMLYAGYQENRPSLASDLKPQILRLHEVLEKMKVRIFEVEGYEADDIIGTISSKLSKEGNVEVVIVSGDRDLLQLVDKNVKIWMPVVGLSKAFMMGEKEVEEKYGVKPSQFVDYKALVGDASDGYPGITGIGPKTASVLLQKFGSFENLYKKLGELPPKISEKLATDAEQGALAKKLATIEKDVPISFDLKKCACSDFDIQATVKEFKKLGFKTLLQRFADSFAPSLETKNLKKEDNEQLSFESAQDKV